MRKQYIVRLTQKERDHLDTIIKKLKGSGEKVLRAQILLKADADGSCWTDRQISEAFSCRTKTVENIRQQFVLNGFQQSLDGKKRKTHPLQSCWTEAGSQDHSHPSWSSSSTPAGYATGHYAC